MKLKQKGRIVIRKVVQEELEVAELDISNVDISFDKGTLTIHASLIDDEGRFISYESRMLHEGDVEGFDLAEFEEWIEGLFIEHFIEPTNQEDL